MRKRIILIVIYLFVISCDRNDILIENPKQTISYLTNYMDYSHLPDGKIFHIVPSVPNGLVEIEFEGRNIARKKGGYGELPSLGVYFFSTEIVDEVFYNKNKIRIDKKSYSTDIDFVYPNLRIIELDNNGLMIKKTNNIVQHALNTGDTIYSIITKEYTYNSEKLLVKTHQTQKELNSSALHMPSNNILSYADASYHYTNNNLDSIVTIEHDFVEQNDTYIPKRKIVETFSNYDASENPLKSLYIFEETFKRSLSKNNYGTYRRDEYYFIDETVMHSSSSQISYLLKYDIQGNIRFDI
jgi:hypothetical protein